MIEEKGRIEMQLVGTKRVVHYKDNIDVIGGRLISYEGTENYEMCKLSGRADDTIDTLQPPANRDALSIADSESSECLTKGCPMHADRQFTGIRQIRQ